MTPITYALREHVDLIVLTSVVRFSDEARKRTKNVQRWQHTCWVQCIDWRILQRHNGDAVMVHLKTSLLIHHFVPCECNAFSCRKGAPYTV